MMRCETCGNDYDKGFQIVMQGQSAHNFDCFECAIQALAPRCERCKVPVLGHGVEGAGKIYCGAHCAKTAGTVGAVDRMM
jgi:hypothetical protein